MAGESANESTSQHTLNLASTPLERQVVEYIRTLLDKGFDLIPCVPKQKRPLYSDWQRRSATDQMRQALHEPGGFNLGVRGGGRANLVVLDCEDKPTTQKVIDWLSMNGVESYPLVRSASGCGCHIWLRCPNIPPHMASYAKLAPHVGQGEVRAGPGAFVLMPPSYAWSERAGHYGHYTFEKPLELFDEMQPVNWNEIVAPLMVNQAQRATSPLSSIPPEELALSLPHRPAPPLVDELLTLLQDAPRGQPIPHPSQRAGKVYASRSEAEQAVVRILILHGWAYPEVARLFQEHQPGHYHDYRHPGQAEAYLQASYRKALERLVDTKLVKYLPADPQTGQPDRIQPLDAEKTNYSHSGGVERTKTSTDIDVCRSIHCQDRVASVPAFTLDSVSSLPVSLPYQMAPPLVDELLATLQTAPRGKAISHPRGTREAYASRSEAEQAIISTLLLCGWSYLQIVGLFHDEQPGHYQDCRQAESYLRLSYRNALQNIVETPERQPILAAYWWAYSSSWPLKSGLARLTYHHVLLTAWKDARLDPVVTYDSLRAATGASNGGLAGALCRLERAGLIQRLPGDPENGEPDRILLLLSDEQLSYRHNDVDEPFLPSARATRLLGRVSYAATYVYCALSDQPQSITDLGAQLKISRDTVSDCLRALEDLGLARQVHRYGWMAGEADVEQLVGQVTPVEASEASHKAESAFVQARQALSALRQAGAALTQALLPEVVGNEDPVLAYVEEMCAVYGCKLRVTHLSAQRQAQLRELASLLQTLYQDERLASPSPRRYIHWAARVYRRVAAEHGWPLLWISVLASSKVLAWYVREHPGAQLSRGFQRPSWQGSSP